MNPRLACSTLLATSLATFAPLAHAAEPTEEHASEPARRLPVAEAERPLTLPRFVLSPEVTFDVTHTIGPTDVNLTLDASFGITDDLTARATVLPLQLTNGFHFGQDLENLGPSVGATYRFLRGPVEIGASLDIGIPTAAATTGVFATPGVPVRIHAGEKVRIDTGVYVPIVHLSRTGIMGQGLATQTTTVEGISVPVSGLYDITEAVHVGLATGFDILDVSNAGDTVAIPLGVFAGYAVARKDGPIVDIDPFFTFPELLTPGAESKTDTVEWVAGVTVGGFIYL